MNGVELTSYQTRMGLPFGNSADQLLLMDPESILAGGAAKPLSNPTQTTTTTTTTPWPALLQANTGSATITTTPSPSALHKMLAELSYGAAPQVLKPELIPSASSSSTPFPPLPASSTASAFPQISNQLFSPAMPYSPANWIRGALPPEFYSSFPHSAHKDPSRHYPQHVTLNGGSLVLDTARGELVNASKMTPKELLEAKALAASKSHSEAERRRRERINNHLARLRTLLPSSTKTDKASLLAEVIEQVKSLKRQVSEIYEYGAMPTDRDELCVEKVPLPSSEGRMVIRASLCCDDRPDLMSDLKDALDTLRLRTLKAEISTLGGRIKNVFIATHKEESGEVEQDISEKRVQEALRLVMDGPGGGELSPGSSNKKQKTSPSSFENTGCA